jgi:hypothetical protein
MPLEYEDLETGNHFHLNDAFEFNQNEADDVLDDFDLSNEKEYLI